MIRLRSLPTLALICSALLAGCSAAPVAPPPADPAVAQPSPTATASPSPSPAPASPAAGFPTEPSAAPSPSAVPPPLPTATPVPWGSYPAPATPPATAVPPPAAALPLPEGVEVLALLGLDREAPLPGRTDAIILVFYNLQSGSASQVSIPRDLYVYLPGWTMERINTAYVWGGVDLLASTLEYNMGVRPHHWALAHLDDFIHFVDELGGVSVQVSHPLPDDCGGIPEGSVHMDGATALCYLRERKTSNDIERSRRQQEFLQEMLARVIGLDGLSRLPEWYERYGGAIETDLTLEDLLMLAPAAWKARAAGIHNFQVGWNEISAWQVPENGAFVFLPQPEKVRALLQQAVDVLAPAADLSTEATPSPPPAGTPEAGPQPASTIASP